MLKVQFLPRLYKFRRKKSNQIKSNGKGYDVHHDQFEKYMFHNECFFNQLHFMLLKETKQH